MILCGVNWEGVKLDNFYRHCTINVYMKLHVVQVDISTSVYQT